MDLARIRAGICSPEEEARCEQEFGAENLAWACENCPKARVSDLSGYTKKLLLARQLQRAGYPFDADSFTLEEWLDLGRLKQCLETPEKSNMPS